MKNNIVCCCFGHREVYKNIDTKLAEAVEYVISKGCSNFMTGGMGQFDNKFADLVRSKKINHPEIKLLLIKPYFSNELNTNKEYYEYMYDDVVVPDIVTGVHYKSAITVRNHWMVDNSNIIIAFICRDFGGAFNAVKYARKQRKEIINVAEES